jgi:cytochrome d ubiquinol oxidase subunit II
MSDIAAGGLLLGVVAYAVLGGADFGAGFWDLTAGGEAAGRRPRALIDRSIGPVWEANHTWLIYCLVVMWTAFPRPFAAIMTTLYLPLGLAALGIVLRGSGFAFRRVIAQTAQRRLTDTAFAASSVITPFFFGTVAGAIAAGRVPLAGYGGPVATWVNAGSLLTGALAVVVCAYLAAVFLVADARRDGDGGLEAWFRRRAVPVAWLAGALVVADLAVAHTTAPRLFTRLTGPALPLASACLVAGALALVLLPRVAPRVVRVVAAAAVAALVVGWGVAQYPYVLGTHGRISATAAPHATLVALTVVFAVAAVVVVPSLVLLFTLQQRDRLEEA